MPREVHDNPSRQRYELEVPGGIVFADYRLRDGILAITHTETPRALQGQGLASKLVEGMIEDARERKLKIMPLCSFVVDYFRRHPEAHDVLADGAD